MVDCDKIRSITVTIIDEDNQTIEAKVYFNVDTMEQISLTDAQLCPNIVEIDKDCVKFC